MHITTKFSLGIKEASSSEINEISLSIISFSIAAAIVFFILLPTKATFLLFFFAAINILSILSMLEEKHVITILLLYLEKILINSSLTSNSDFEKPGTSALVESPIKASNPSLPIFSNCL